MDTVQNRIDFFNDFLKASGAFDAYYRNVKYKGKAFDAWLSRAFLYDLDDGMFFLSFMWSCTPEGFDYWAGIGHKWHEFVADLKDR